MGIKNNLTKQEAIKRIEQVYHSKYKPGLADFDAFEQLLVCESINETIEGEKENRNVNVSVNGNDTYKLLVNFELTDRKLLVISQLQHYNYKTPLYLITEALEEIFQECESKPTHWSYIAQNYTPRTINRVINLIDKTFGKHWNSLQNPAAYFTSIIKFRKKRKPII